jgi:hypothetical protein
VIACVHVMHLYAFADAMSYQHDPDGLLQTQIIWVYRTLKIEDYQNSVIGITIIHKPASAVMRQCKKSIAQCDHVTSINPNDGALDTIFICR